MALTDPTDTLAYHQSRVLTSHRDMRDVPLKDVIAQVNKFLAADKEKSTVPETEALFFYGLNHGMALIGAKYAPLEPLPKWELEFVEKYHRILGPKAVRAFYYLLLICTRESRHNQSLVKDTPKMKELFGEPVVQFLTSIKGGESTIYQKLLDSPPDCTIGTFVDCLCWQFYHSKWNGGYGGKAWGKVNDCLCRFVSGEFTAEMMLDTIWTLCHNNGPIFNKGICYGHHSSTLIRVLDIQRSGQIPQAVLFDKPLAQFVQHSLQVIMFQVKEHFAEIGSYVDWNVVEALGSVQQYPSEKKDQAKNVPLTPEQIEAQKKAAADALAKIEAKAKADAEAAAIYAKSHFEIMPGLAVKKFERAA